MPINKEKSAAYLRYRRSLGGVTYAEVTSKTGVPGSTLSAYFNANVQSPNREIFERLMLAVGGSWEEYDAWEPEVRADVNEIKTKDVTEDVKLLEVIESIKQSFEANAVRMESAYNASIAKLEASHAKAERTHRIEKYVLFFLLVTVAVYAVFAFTHYDLKDPTTGLTSLFGG